MSITRRRSIYAALALGTVAVGLLVHNFGSALGPVTRDVTGDALWAMMIVWWVRVVAPRASFITVAVVAFAICFAVEVSQLYHTPGFDALRTTSLGALVFGSGYDTRDLIAYAFGVCIAIAIDALVSHSWHRQ